SLPIHLAWRWLDLNLKTPSPHKAVMPPHSLGSGLPYCQRNGKGLFVSYATFVCPESCPSPPQICFKTKEKRPFPLWKFLAEQRQRGSKGFLEVIESRQLAPGVGGFPFKELRKLLDLGQKVPPPFFVATACRCHGVIHGLTW
ncbi:MAG: potassium transporter, partial [Desulfobacca sp.]|nr:potassium transporter [Desulfobacca sp.]